MTAETADKSEFESACAKVTETSDMLGNSECGSAGDSTTQIYTGSDCKPYIGGKEEARKTYSWLIYNEYVLSGYRINYFSWNSLMKSICHTHNETANIWTHFLPGIVFLLFILIGWICKPGFLLFSQKSLSAKSEEDQANFGVNITPFTGRFLDSFYSKCCEGFVMQKKAISDLMTVNECLSESLSARIKDLYSLEEKLRTQAKQTFENSQV